MALISSVASEQHALATLEQMDARGVSRRQRDHLVATGVIRRVRPRVYAVAAAPTTWQQTMLAAVLSAGSGAVASHAGAARLWHFARQPRLQLEITVPTLERPRLRGVGVHRTTVLEREDRAVIDGIPTTSFERTLCDLTTRLAPEQLGRALDDGLRRGVAALDRLRACVERLDSGPGRRLSVVQQLLRARGDGFHPGGSRAELDLLDIWRNAGLPLPVQQYEVRVERKTFVLDYAWPELRVFAEYYGLPYHIGAAAVVHDSERITAMVEPPRVMRRLCPLRGWSHVRATTSGEVSGRAA
jgi:hypothetical protein